MCHEIERCIKNILCIDGGGMKGLIPCLVLVELEARAKKLCCEIFDLISGTSIGGIMAGLLAVGIPASEAAKFFTEDGPVIFRKTWWRRFGLLAPRYSAETIEQVLQRRFGDLTLRDCKTKLLVTSLDVVSKKPYFFNNFTPGFINYKLWQVTRATSAAQTYFPPLKLGKMILWDGGNIANNPSLCALAHTSTFQGDEKMLSLGCGRTIDKPFKKWLKNVCKSHIKLIYRLVCIINALGAPIIIIGWITGGYIATHGIMADSNAKSTGVAVANLCLSVIVGMALTLLGIRVLALGHIIKTTIYALIHIAPALQNECVQKSTLTKMCNTFQADADA
jgi:hypothetical protein